MSDTRTLPAEKSRVVITIASGDYSDTTIEYAVSMAAHLNRPLHGIFIEDTDLLTVAGLPFSTEICSTTGQPKHFDTGKLQSDFSDIVMRFQQRLAQSADPKAVRWSVSSVRGRRRDLYFDTSTAADWCIYEGADEFGTSHPKKRGTTASTTRHLLLINGEDTAFYQALSSLLAPLKEHQLHVSLINTSACEHSPDLSSFLPTGTHIHSVAKEQLPDMLQHPAIPLDYVVISRHHWPSEFAPLLSRLKCPLIVVG